MPTKSLSELAVDLAVIEARSNVFETNNDNRGPRVDEYSVAANNTLGQAWCAKFAWWCFEQAARRIGTTNPFPRIFGALEIERWAHRNNKAVETPQKGDVLVRMHNHVGLVAGPPTRVGTVPSVEGNTWAKTDFANRKEGVYELTNRKIIECTFFRLS